MKNRTDPESFWSSLKRVHNVGLARLLVERVSSEGLAERLQEDLRDEEEARALGRRAPLASFRPMPDWYLQVRKKWRALAPLGLLSAVNGRPLDELPTFARAEVHAWTALAALYVDDLDLARRHLDRGRILLSPPGVRRHIYFGAALAALASQDIERSKVLLGRVLSLEPTCTVAQRTLFALERIESCYYEGPTVGLVRYLIRGYFGLPDDPKDREWIWEAHHSFAH